MGEIVLAAKITHVPSMFISEEDGPHQGCRQPAIDGLKEIGDRIRETGVDTIVIADTHWLVNAGYHINANTDCSGIYTSTEFPHFIRNLEYRYVGDAELGEAIARKATEMGTFTRCHTDVPSLAQLDALIEMDPTRSTDYYNRARILEALGRTEPARRDFDKFLSSTRLPVGHEKVTHAFEFTRKHRPNAPDDS